MISRMRASSLGSTATSISPMTLCLISSQPDHRIVTPTSAARIASSCPQPVTAASITPNSTPAVDTTSVHRCRPSATSAGERSFRPCRTSHQAHPALSPVATTLTPIPTGSASNGRGATKPVQACWKITSAATAMKIPISTAEKYSAL